ncbi:MAG TPA: hypothetical protein VGN82_19145 [Bosea sp. (in: a-proteobacteria)]|uniref:hypothetical protein n=1 Tax=Bosea sp. (in: a-proteobacteria) TaxID=1871050 RepID=UPI002E120FC1|nr:hypothetical protein [Bosea sp. (in: a-proteobacteria)]
MITLFILLGLGFLGGGIAAIVDGLPYMVLERGFTQVIIGTVVAAAGVVMLALSWVLVELRRLRKTLSNAATAISVASMVGGPAPDNIAPMPRLPSEPEDIVGTTRPGLAVAGAGALVGAGAVLAATQISASAATEKPEDSAAEIGPADTLPADPVEPAPDPEREADVVAYPAFEPFRPMAPIGEAAPVSEVAAEREPEVDLVPVPTFEAEIEVEADAPEVESEPEPDSLGVVAEQSESLDAAAPPAEPLDHLAEPYVPSDIEDPLTPEPASAASREADEFGLLRESLVGLGVGPAPTDGRIEPSFAEVDGQEEGGDGSESGRDDDLAAAASWMTPDLARRTPWFGPAEPAAEDREIPTTSAQFTNPSEMVWPKLDISRPEAPEPEATDPDVPGRDLPQWPPHARAAAPFEPAPPPSQRQGWNDAGREQASGEEAPALASDDEEQGGSEAEPIVPDATAAEGDAAPAASEEGIVGAYQVGEAHFTIYADGSIQARTPDGDYSFGSMDELKVYLASEKSRLGV